MTSVATHNALADAAAAVRDAVLDMNDRPDLDTFDLDGDLAPVVAAALAEKGWSLSYARAYMPDLFDFDPREDTQIEAQARSVRDPWGTLLAGAPSFLERTLLDLRSLLEEFSHLASDLPEAGGVSLDLDAAPAAPRWLVPDLIVRGKTHMLSGGVHALKTGLREAMMVASLTGRPFLGREVPRLRWLIIDGENSREDIQNRWRAMGLRGEHMADVHLTTREANVRLGEEQWNDWLAREIEDFRPDVLIIDTIARCCGGVNNNDENSVAAFFGDVLVPLVDRHDLALIFTKHHRKSGGRSGTDEAVNGSVQWSGQAEQTITVATTGALEFTPQPDGTTKTSRKFVLRRPKGRAVVSNAPEHFEAKGLLDADGALLAFEVVAPSAEPTDVERLVAGLDAPLGRKALAEAVALSQTGTRFRKALDEAIDGGVIVKNSDGLYERVES